MAGVVGAINAPLPPLILEGELVTPAATTPPVSPFLPSIIFHSILHDRSMAGKAMLQYLSWTICTGYQISENATSIILVKVFCRSSAVVASPVRIWSETVQMARARLPERAAFI